MAVSYGYNRQRPRTEVFLDASNLGSANIASEKPLVLIGSANGGEPHVAHTITNYAQARELFRSGDLLDAIELAWNPSPTAQGAGKIIAMRTDQATQAKLTNGGLTVTSKLYGTDANSIQVEYGDNTITNSKRLSVYFTKERYEQTYDNIGNIFTVQYKGEEAQATIAIEVDADTHLATRLVLSAGADAESLQAIRTYELGQGVYQDVNVLVNDINNLPDFEAQMNPLGGNKNIETQYLDPIADQDVKTAKVTVKAVGADLMNQTANDTYISISVDRAVALPSSFTVTNLSGAKTEPAPASWAELFSKIADLGAYYIVPLTSDAAIHGELSQFLRDESNNGNHLRGIVGGGFKESMDQLKTRQLNLRNSRVSVVGDSVTRRMSDGRVLNAPAYMYASEIAGIASGLEIGEPITYKHVNIEALDRKFTGDQLDQLNDAGIIMTEFVRTRTSSHFRIVSDPTTYNVSTEPVQNRISLGEISDFLTTELRTMLDEDFIGTRIRATSASVIKNAVESFLDQQKNVGGLIVDYNPDDVQVVITGNTARIAITVQPSQGLDYINVYLTYEDNELTA
ncbi:putative tail sheath protein [Bacillus phage BSP36]|uniref:Putative tail sheath protein n=1 Tax=Bacillus phage BSP38 TaxID=2283013 RepID=A0A345MJU0_BPBSP|nr:tail sheath [Bacillus phage BSP38]AXH71122.1 putative tail sheath protein [Bacillus phage BSP38]AYJ75164.1 putative tail sheath protein [Bacillus phage BSP36]